MIEGVNFNGPRRRLRRPLDRGVILTMQGHRIITDSSYGDFDGKEVPTYDQRINERQLVAWHRRASREKYLKILPDRSLAREFNQQNFKSLMAKCVELGTFTGIWLDRMVNSIS